MRVHVRILCMCMCASLVYARAHLMRIMCASYACASAHLRSMKFSPDVIANHSLAHVPVCDTNYNPPRCVNLGKTA